MGILMILSAVAVLPMWAGAESEDDVSAEIISKGSTWYYYQTEHAATMEEGAPSETWMSDDGYRSWE